MAKSQIKTVLVACGTRPEIGAAVELVVRDCAARHGWAERLELRLAGLGDGVGSADLASNPVVAASDCGSPLQECADLDQTPELLTGVAIVVADCQATAARLVSMPELGQARLLCLSEVGLDFFEGDSPTLEGNFGSLLEGAPELLRRLIAAPSEAHSKIQIGVPTAAMA